MAARPLLILGTGGLARETAEVVRTVPGYELVGFLDDDPSRHGRMIDGVPVLGPVEDAKAGAHAVVVATGSPRDFDSRRRIVARLGLAEERYATLVHPAAVVSPTCVVGPGSILLAGVVLTAAVTVGRHVVLMPHTVLTHDTVVADFATTGAGVCLSGGVRIGAGAYLGARSVVRENLTVGAGAMVGMGSVVTRDVPDGEVWFGSPARPHTPHPRPWPPREVADKAAAPDIPGRAG